MDIDFILSPPLETEDDDVYAQLALRWKHLPLFVIKLKYNAPNESQMIIMLIELGDRVQMCRIIYPVL